MLVRGIVGGLSCRLPSTNLVHFYVCDVKHVDKCCIEVIVLYASSDDFSVAAFTVLIKTAPQHAKDLIYFMRVLCSYIYLQQKTVYSEAQKK